MTWQVYDLFRKRQNDGNGADLDTPGGNGFKVALVDSSYTINLATHEFWDDGPEANEVTGTNYTTVGNLCATPLFTGPDGAGLLTFDATDPDAWAQHASGFTDARYAVLLLDTGTAGTSRLVAVEDMTTDRGNVAGPFSIEFADGGIITLPR